EYADDLHDYTAKLFNWRKGCKAVQDGKTLHFLSRANIGASNITDNTYAYFRYTDTDAVFVYINNSFEPHALDWNHYREFVEGPVNGRDVLTGENITLRNGITIAPKSALVVEFKR
ncbi:MAG: cyclomaltodextrinase C-terminal domain-containing protein, partial [Bacteroidales bacterium]|nr:cyclomaltodextrinase C-terminal domain-containing protein [Bacteroidales bacterium]